MSDDKKAFSERLRQVVDRVGGVQEIARIAGVSPQSVYGWLAGSRPYRDRVVRISLAVGCRPEWLFDGIGPETADDHTPARREDYSPLSRVADDDLAARLAEMVSSFAAVPTAFAKDALATINSHHSEFRHRAELKIASRAK